jgi:plastocyanin
VLISVTAAACGSSEAEQPAAVASDAPIEAKTKALGASVSGAGPSGTMVLLEPLFEHEFTQATGPTYMDQTGLEFIPAVLTAQTGQTVQFRNNEDILHNVRVQETGTHVPVFNVATTPYNSYPYTFEKPGYYDVTCDIHTAMRATVVVTSTPHVQVADGTGRFAFAGVVPGRYKVTWFEKGTPRHKEVEIRAPGTDLALP